MQSETSLYFVINLIIYRECGTLSRKQGIMHEDKNLKTLEQSNHLEAITELIHEYFFIFVYARHTY